MTIKIELLKTLEEALRFIQEVNNSSCTMLPIDVLLELKLCDEVNKLRAEIGEPE